MQILCKVVKKKSEMHIELILATNPTEFDQSKLLRTRISVTRLPSLAAYVNKRFYVCSCFLRIL
jgi:hypothetical protein